jgi:8-oxo-dGTP diphosphatase
VPGLDRKWELPGGKIEFGEAPDQALVREIREEIGTEITPLRLLPYLHTNIWEYEHAVQHVVLAGYECELKDNYTVSDSEDVCWFDVGAIDFATTLPGTQEFISLALKADWFDQLYIRFEYVDRTVNAIKYCVISAQPTLFSRYGFVRYSWDGEGRKTRLTREQFKSPKEMDERLFSIVRTRLSSGYVIKNLQGAANRYKVLDQIVGFAKAKQALAEELTVN